MQPVIILGVGSTLITNKPDQPLYQLLLEAARLTLADAALAPEGITGLLTTSMGRDQYVHLTGELNSRLAADLGLDALTFALDLRGTSSSGLLPLVDAFQRLKYDSRPQTLLIIAGEQMNMLRGEAIQSTEMEVGARRLKVADIIASVIEPEERRYGLKMLHIGDLLQSALNARLGLDLPRMNALHYEIARAKYAHGTRYRLAQYRTYDEFPRERYFKPSAPGEKRHPLTPLLCLHDVAPTSSNACAVIVTNDPRRVPAGDRVVHIRGVGQGMDHPALSRRTWPFTSSRALALAVARACGEAHLTLEEMRALDVGLPHDAFPAIEWTILLNMGYSFDDAMAGITSGRFNPLGGLKACGHPVGSTGLQQLVRLTQLLRQDGRVIEPAAFATDPRSGFIVNVGAALTNLVAVIVACSDRAEALRETQAQQTDMPVPEPPPSTAPPIPPDAARVLARTRTDRGPIVFLQRADGSRCFVVSDGSLDVGDICRERGDGAGLLNAAAL